MNYEKELNKTSNELLKIIHEMAKELYSKNIRSVSLNYFLNPDVMKEDILAALYRKFYSE